jgi:hypothetical protein
VIAAMSFTVPSTLDWWVRLSSRVGGREQLVEVGEVEAAVLGQADEGELEPGALGGELPGDEVAVVLHQGEH